MTIFVYINLECHIVTRNCVPITLLRKWRPSASGSRPLATAQDKCSDCDSDSDIEYEGDDTSPLAGPVPLPSTQPALTVSRHLRDRSEDEEVINISGKKKRIQISKSLFTFFYIR